MPLRPSLKTLPSPTITTSSPLPFTSSAHVNSPHVHFPPTPTMTQTEATHSPFSYDRKPIVVVPNVCALPERGGRRFDVQSGLSDRNMNGASTSEKMMKGGYFHPRACEAFEYEGPLDPASLLFEHDSAAQQAPSQPYPYPYPHHLRPNQSLQNPSQHRERDIDRLSKHIPPPLVFDSSESDSSDMGSPPTSLANTQAPPSHPYHYSRQVSMDLSLPFLSAKEGISLPLPPSLKKRASPQRIPSSLGEEGGLQWTRAGSLHRTRKVVSSASASSAACVGFNAGFYEPGLEGCLGGF